MVDTSVVDTSEVDTIEIEMAEPDAPDVVPIAEPPTVTVADVRADRGDQHPVSSPRVSPVLWFTGPGVLDAPRGPTWEPAAVAGDPLVDPVQEPRHGGDAPGEQRKS